MREYLPNQQAKQKWTEVRRNLQEGEVVLILDPNVPRGTRPTARVEKAYAGDIKGSIQETHHQDRASGDGLVEWETGTVMS